MEIVKVITRAGGGQSYVKNALEYCLDDRRLMTKGYGIDKDDPAVAAMQFRKTAEFWNNHSKNPLIQYMISFSCDTAPTAEKAMHLTEEILSSVVGEHQAVTVAHKDENDVPSFHTHTVAGATNYNDGAMMYSDNRTNYAIAQRAADVTGEPVTLVVSYEQGSDWECPKHFLPEEESGKRDL